MFEINYFYTFPLSPSLLLHRHALADEASSLLPEFFLLCWGETNAWFSTLSENTYTYLTWLLWAAWTMYMQVPPTGAIRRMAGPRCGHATTTMVHEAHHLLPAAVRSSLVWRYTNTYYMAVGLFNPTETPPLPLPPTHVHARTHTNTHKYIHLHTHNTHTHACTYIHTHTYTHTHNTHTRTLPAVPDPQASTVPLSLGICLEIQTDRTREASTCFASAATFPSFVNNMYVQH